MIHYADAYWLPTGIASISLLIFFCFLGWLYQRHWRARFDRLVDDVLDVRILTKKKRRKEKKEKRKTRREYEKDKKAKEEQEPKERDEDETEENKLRNNTATLIDLEKDNDLDPQRDPSAVLNGKMASSSRLIANNQELTPVEISRIRVENGSEAADIIEVIKQ
jgi:hypothetical protein